MISGKGGKSRLLPIGNKAIEVLQQWLKVRPSVEAADNAVFTSMKGKRIGNRNIQLRLRQWCLKKGIPEPVHPVQPKIRPQVLRRPSLCPWWAHQNGS